MRVRVRVCLRVQLDKLCEQQPKHFSIVSRNHKVVKLAEETVLEVEDRTQAHDGGVVTIETKRHGPPNR